MCVCDHSYAHSRPRLDHADALRCAAANRRGTLALVSAALTAASADGPPRWPPDLRGLGPVREKCAQSGDRGRPDSVKNKLACARKLHVCVCSSSRALGTCALSCPASAASVQASPWHGGEQPHRWAAGATPSRPSLAHSLSMDPRSDADELAASLVSSSLRCSAKRSCSADAGCADKGPDGWPGGKAVGVVGAATGAAAANRFAAASASTRAAPPAPSPASSAEAGGTGPGSRGAGTAETDPAETWAPEPAAVLAVAVAVLAVTDCGRGQGTSAGQLGGRLVGRGGRRLLPAGGWEGGREGGKEGGASASDMRPAQQSRGTAPLASLSLRRRSRLLARCDAHCASRFNLCSSRPRRVTGPSIGDQPTRGHPRPTAPAPPAKRLRNVRKGSPRGSIQHSARRERKRISVRAPVANVPVAEYRPWPAEPFN